MDDQRWVRWLYINPGRQVCIGSGHVLHTLSDLLGLPWTSPGRRTATLQQVEDAWRTVSEFRMALKVPSVNEMRAKTSIRLDYR